MCGFTLPKLLWMKNHEKDNFESIDKIMLPKDYLVLWMKNHEKDNFESINKIMLPKDYLVYKLSGNFVSDKSDLINLVVISYQISQI